MLSALFFLWFLRLFKPEWLIAFHVPGLGAIRALPSIVLYITLGYLIAFRTEKVEFDKPFACFLVCTALSAMFAENVGLALKGLQQVLDNFAFFVINLTILARREDAQALKKLFHLYVLSFLIYGLVGITHKGIVPNHVFLDDEDFFGPFMGLGVAISFLAACQQGKANRYYLLTAIISVVGLIASFARGAFLSFCSTGLYIWSRSSDKGRNAVIVGIASILVIVATIVLFPENKYWKEMGTIGESIQDEKSEGRHFLIKKGIDMFYLYPFTGTGPLNYGYVLQKITSETEARERGTHLGFFAHRVAHNIYVQILAEQGIFGSAAFAVVISSFWMRSRRIRKMCGSFVAESSDASLKGKQSYSSQLFMLSFSLQAAMVSYLINGIFYPILSPPWFCDLLILNTLIYRNMVLLTKGRN